MAYDPPKFEHAITLQLSRNESICAIDDLEQQMGSLGRPFVSFYPSHLELQALIGQSIGVDSDRIVITAGGDESIDRVMRIALGGKRRTIVAHAPSFEMIDIYARNYGGRLDTVKWLGGEFPMDAFTGKINSETALAVVVSPNNPTGGLISAGQIIEVADAAKASGCKLLVDNAYIEFADTDPTLTLSAHGNVMIVRTFSKAWGLAGLRIGYLIAPDVDFATQIRNASGPFPVSAVSLETARRSLTDYKLQMAANVKFVKTMRTLLTELLEKCGASVIPSQGNFLLAEFSDAARIWDELAVDGVAVRKFTGSPLLENRLRVTCPALPGDYLQLAHSLCRIHGLDLEIQKNALLQFMAESSDEMAAIPQTDVASSSSTADLTRQTKETNIRLELNLYGTGVAEIETGIGFLDHMLTALTFHSRMDLKLKCVGDLHVDDHHTAEDCALALGTAIDQALGKRTGIKRFGFAYAPLDEALARTVIDLSGRPWPEIHLQLEREMVGQWACENIVHFFQSLAMTLKCSLHIDVLRGSNDHHRAEAAFKSLAMALRSALTKTDGAVPSTKGVL